MIQKWVAEKFTTLFGWNLSLVAIIFRVFLLFVRITIWHFPFIIIIIISCLPTNLYFLSSLISLNNDFICWILNSTDSSMVSCLHLYSGYLNLVLWICKVCLMRWKTFFISNYFFRNSYGTTQTTCRRWCVIKYPLIAMVLMYFSLKFLIVEDMQEWSPETPRDVSLYIFPSENTTIIYPRKLDEFARTRLDMLLIVTTDPAKSERRNAIRQTWGKDQKDMKLAIIFLVGLTRKPEVTKVFKWKINLRSIPNVTSLKQETRPDTAFLLIGEKFD